MHFRVAGLIWIYIYFKKHLNEYNKYRISETDRATNFLKATVYFQDVVYTCICDLEDREAIFGADTFYPNKYKDVEKSREYH